MSDKNTLIQAVKAHPEIYIAEIWEAVAKKDEHRSFVNILKARRRTIRLTGYKKVSSLPTCICGSEMIGSNHPSGWNCIKEQQEWDYIIYKLTGEK